MNAYEQLLEDFDLEIGEIFAYNNANYIVEKDSIYKKVPRLLPNTGGYIYYDYDLAKELMLNMLLGKIKRVKKWIPKLGEVYYIPELNSDSFYEGHQWDDIDFERQLLKRGLIYKTKEEAIKACKDMLGVLR